MGVERRRRCINNGTLAVVVQVRKMIMFFPVLKRVSIVYARPLIRLSWSQG
jgi:hypothetical protein